MTALRVGTAGWSLSRAQAEDFPGPGTHLERYARRLGAAEINSSFYRPHKPETYRRWADGVPADFRFAVKLPKSITHEKRLAGYDDLLDRFAEEVSGLGPKFGALLIQLPPSLAFSGIAAAFLEDIASRFSARLVCEPRHASWFTPEIDGLFAACGVARVAADPAPVPGAGIPGGDRRTAYFRLHGAPRIYWSDYEGPALDEWRRRARETAAGGAETWVIFDNTAAGFALRNALALTA